MDFLKLTKVQNVQLEKSKEVIEGTLHLTTHQMIFKYSNEKEELWISYPIIHTVERRPPTSEPKLWPLLIKCRNFIFVTLSVPVEREAIDVFDTIQKLTCISSISQVYAFYYTPEKEFKSQDGWNVYDPLKEFDRMGICTITETWRFSHFCPTYPYILVVPHKISDSHLNYAAKFRSKCRIPTLSYLHRNKASITRSSQPMVGIQQKRSIQDEKLIQAIFESHLNISPNGRPVYGSTAHNLIIDARPTANAMANAAMGLGSENTEYYKNCEKRFMGIDNIHVMRESLAKVVEVLQAADSQGLPIKKYQLDKSNWLKHVSVLLSSAYVIIENVNVKASHVLVHCSDGWDRTAQLTSISELCLDPYYRTFNGFQVLIEKEWVSFGHKFSDRSGHLSNERYFINASNTNAAGSAFSSVQSKFKQSHVRETSPVFHQFLDCVYQLFQQNPTRFEFNERFLVDLHYHSYSCQFGTFLFNSEKERHVYNVNKKTHSVWDYFNSNKGVFLNPSYCGEKEDRDPRDMGVLYPDAKNVKYWAGLFRKKDEELNGNGDEGSDEKSEEGMGARIKWRSDSPTGSLNAMTDPLGAMGIGDLNSNNIVEDIASVMTNISSPFVKSMVDFDAGLDPWKTHTETNGIFNGNDGTRDLTPSAREKGSNVFASLTAAAYSNVVAIASKINSDLDENNTYIKKSNSNESSKVATPVEELEESKFNSAPREMMSFGTKNTKITEDNNCITTSINSNGRQFPSLFLSRGESNRNSLPSLGVRTTPPSSPYLRTISGTSTPTYEKQILSPITLSSNNNYNSNSPSPKIRSSNSDLEKSLMIATNTSINSSGLGLGLNFGAIMSLGVGSNTNSKPNSPLHTPPIPSSPVPNSQDKMKELPHPLYNVDLLSSP
ncbi:671_t:CDS:2 [Funneliformis caledonium]|uniref:671_t:CDS:1 n=2 Tax=Funneliformis TaxID=1117308 RepID=A0A9N8UXW6_9GLOM|nr:671_t:CDS:2 [Funneliformis caledonium]CAG8474510.1 6584_t:CDS:2 [Funneliformis mosseae]